MSDLLKNRRKNKLKIALIGRLAIPVFRKIDILNMNPL